MGFHRQKTGDPCAESSGMSDDEVGSKTQACGTFNWGRMARPDQYHFTISQIDGQVRSGPVNVDSVRQSY